MDTRTILMIVVGLVILLAAGTGVWLSARNRRSQKLREKYGPEYDLTLEHMGDRQTAEEMLIQREKRVDKLDIRALDAHESEQYRAQWADIQASFVDQPGESVQKAGALIDQMMEARGFPSADFEQRAADISVKYPDLVTNYRNAHAISEKAQQDGVSTEDLRLAMVHYRTLFEELNQGEANQEKEAKVS